MINELAQTAFDTAIIRGKTARDMNHLDTFFGIFSELKEFREASEIDPSEHLPEYTQAQEELTDVLICCLTELYRREVNVEEITKHKIGYHTKPNETRMNYARLQEVEPVPLGEDVLAGLGFVRLP